MNENYLNYLNNYFVASGMTINYPIVDTDYTSLYGETFYHQFGETFYHQADQVITVKRKDVSFIKKEVPKFSMQETPKFIGDLSDQDMEYFQKRLFEALKLPNWVYNRIFNINYDEFH